MHIQDLRLPLERGFSEAREIYLNRLAWISVAGLLGIAVSIFAIFPISSFLLLLALITLLFTLVYIDPDSRVWLLLLSIQLSAIIYIMSLSWEERPKDNDEYLKWTQKTKQLERAVKL